MDTTFITIHELTPEARILYSSDSIVDVLGYSPQEVLNHSCWEYFHPDEVPMAQARYGRGVEQDKASVISYCRMRDCHGEYVGCESVFTIVYDCVVGCTSVYRRGHKSQNRAAEAPVVRRLFSTNPRDPRYHMLSHLSPKFNMSAKPSYHESRAALFLNRYTKSLTIMYATNGLVDELGISGEELRGRSFYCCIQQACLPDAIKCLENAKANDSIAYLRFWFRDPRQDDVANRRSWRNDNMDIDIAPDVDRSLGSESEDTDMGGVKLEERTPQPPSPSSRPGSTNQDSSVESQAMSSDSNSEPLDTAPQHLALPDHAEGRASSGDSVDPMNTTEHIFGEVQPQQSSESSMSNSPIDERQLTPVNQWHRSDSIELEAVVSCTSDGLVVCLRRARGAAALSELREPTSRKAGLFAVPWATDPIVPPQPPGMEQGPQARAGAQQNDSRGLSLPSPDGQEYMNSIREIAVFAWALTGINGSIAQYSTGTPRGHSQPAQGLPIWQPRATADKTDMVQPHGNRGNNYLPPGG